MNRRRPIVLVCALLLAIVSLALPRPSDACTTQGCVFPGPRLASVDANNASLLNLLLGHLANTSLGVSQGNWNTLSTGEVNLASMLGFLQTTLGTATTAQTLSANATLAQIVNAAASAANAQGNTTLRNALNATATALAGASSTVRLGDMLTIAGTPGNSTVNALNLVAGVVTLYNYYNVSGVPTPMSVDLANLFGLVQFSGANISAQVVTPPRYICAGAGSVFKAASLRLKMNLNLVAILPDTGALSMLLNPTVTIGHMDLWLEIASVNDTLATIDAVSNALSVQATPGVADLYLGIFQDTVFFNRSHVLVPATDLTPSPIGVLGFRILIITYSIPIYARGQAHAQAGSASGLNFTAPFPRALTASFSAGASSSLTSALMTNMTITLGPNILGVLLDPVLNVLKPIVALVLSPPINAFMSGVVDPALNLLGIRPGEVVVTANAPYALCTIAGAAYTDTNHSAHREAGEAGTGLSLMAKLINSSNPSQAAQVATIDSGTGSYTFSNVLPAGYTVIVDNNATLNDVTSFRPAGWIGTEAPAQSRSFTLALQDLTNESFGLYNGSNVTGSVFNDNGAGSGTANNGIRDGTEATLPGIALEVLNSAGSTTYDAAVSADAGAYTLWIPAAAGANALKIVETNSPSMISVAGTAGTTAGSYDRVADTLSFTNVLGSQFSGVNFADVSTNLFDTDGAQTVLPGTVAFYSHAFVAGTVGQVTFSAAAPATPGWTHVIHRDTNCNAVIDAGEVVTTAATAAAAGERICVVVRVLAPASAAMNEQFPLALNASFAYSNNPLTTAHTRTDLTTVGSEAAGLHLSKSVDRATAQSGDVLAYTIVYTNAGPAPLRELRIHDATPAYTRFSTATCGALATGLTACTVTTLPAVGASGAIEWTFSGELAPGASGSVNLSVVLE